MPACLGLLVKAHGETADQLRHELRREVEVPGGDMHASPYMVYNALHPFTHLQMLSHFHAAYLEYDAGLSAFQGASDYNSVETWPTHTVESVEHSNLVAHS